MQSLKEQIYIQLAAGIIRKSVNSCSRYAMNYRIMGKPFPGPVNFNRHPWAREMHDTDESWVGPKAAQMAYTETALDRSFYTIDIKRTDVLYLLPKKNPDATDFSKARFDAALELSSHLSQLFSNTRNVGHKQAGSVNFYLRGTRSKSSVKSLAVGLLILDELDEMVQANLPQAEERLSGQEFKQIIKISTPTVPNFGIDKAYRGTTQENFIFRCPRCSKLTGLDFPGSLVICGDNPDNQNELIKSHIICPLCKGKLEHKLKQDWLKNGRWQAFGDPKAHVRGFGINQLYSSTVAPWEIARKALIAQYDPAEEQEYWNSKGGVAHVVAGARVTDLMIDSCLGSHKTSDPYTGDRVVTMGVDVGYRWLHYEISEWFIPSNPAGDLNANSLPRVLTTGKVETFAELESFMRQYQIQGCVIDANPDHRKALDFAVKFDGFVWLCYYSRWVKKTSITTKDEDRTITVNRTSWLDAAIGRFKKGKQGIVLPSDLPQEYREHIKALIRKPGKDADGNPTATYINVAADHHGHARVYNELALPLCVSRLQNVDLGELL